MSETNNSSEEENDLPVQPPFSPDTIIESVVLSYPAETIRNVFSDIGIHCFNCPVGPHDDLETVANLHDMNEQKLINALNDHLSERSPLPEPSYFD